MKMTLTQSILSHACIGASALLLTMGAAQATEPVAGKTISFSQLDTNRDGYIDAKEADASPEIMRLMSTADKDKDGRLSANEFLAAVSAVNLAPKPAQ